MQSDALPQEALLQVTVHSQDADPSQPTKLSDAHSPHSFASPIRHHQRTPSAHREIKETLDAHVEFTSDESDGRTYHRINQYVILDEIGRGSYGAVHMATDQYGNEFAIKEFSKTRLRKRAQSHLLRQGPRGIPGRAPRLSSLSLKQRNDALYLIREEIAIMKKLNHPNLVQLIEVLDDPEEDSLYMVLEMCKKGVVMKVGIDVDAHGYDDETCRCWFRDLILGIEYLHAQGVIHRDIKPENLLLSDDQVLKIVDFGVSEMFEKPESMMTAKSAGSPAFLPPELCGKHKEVSGTAADIWSMGVSLFCLRYGRIPFNRPGVLEIYEAIKTDDPCFPAGEDPVFVDLMAKILHKDASKRITMAELREHPWVTKGGTDHLLSAEENCAHLIEPPNELELNRAFTRKMNHLLCVMKAIHRFKTLLSDIRLRAACRGDSQGAAIQVQHDAQTQEIETLLVRRRELLGQADEAEADDAKGHAQQVDDHEPRFLGIGAGAAELDAHQASPYSVSDSPTAVDFDIYSCAYHDAVNSRLANHSGRPTLYLNKFVKETEQLSKVKDLIVDAIRPSPALKTEIQNSKQHWPSAPREKVTQLVSKVAMSTSRGPETNQREA
ncbi:hypothetical protein CDD82_7953 [Ophiocordyceps australis]|uniref:Protein kinase domain-containing protein n=1 Tax=Ophiocordyceps australis TaxID=1399860 RepID=A0A2C5YI27_9HYPO|nr:hypothetical protein CDD82_7953 [Ophiocordyceps australis]